MIIVSSLKNVFSGRYERHGFGQSVGSTDQEQRSAPPPPSRCNHFVYNKYNNYNIDFILVLIFFSNINMILN